MGKEIETWASEYELRQFIDMAMRWGIDGVYNDRNENRPFSIFTHTVENARANYEQFCSQLNTKLTAKENWKAIGIDLKSRFLVGINQYIDWYGKNKNKLEKFQPHCPYSLMLNVVESTKGEILQYFPELEIESKIHQKKIGSFEFTNNFDRIETKDVYDHFTTGLVNSKMLTEKELENFLIAAFQNQTIPAKLFKLKGGVTKGSIVKVFYQYYKDIAGKTHGKQKEYAGLLGDYFQGYQTSTISSNFSKSAY